MTYLILFFIFASAVICRFAIKFFLFKKQMSQMALKSLLQKSTLKSSEILFSSHDIKEIVNFLSFSIGKEAKTALFYLSFGKSDPAKKYLINHNKTYLAAILTALSNEEYAIEMFSSLEQTDDIKAILAELSRITSKKEEAQNLLNELKFSALSLNTRAIALYCRAKFALEIGDLYNAENDCGSAIRIFREENCPYEEARAYLLLGEIYRISAAGDTSYFMYRNALDIAKKINIESLQADILASIGMLYVMEERFEEAQDAFERSLDLNKKLLRDTASANLYNQLGLLKIIQGKYDEAVNFINCAMGYSIAEATAMSFELTAKIHYAKKDFSEAIKNSAIAQSKYWKNNNLTAYFESAYLEALSQFYLKNYAAAEQKLRHIITVANENENAFYIANAYSLLAMTCMEEDKMTQAKAFLEESVRLELRDNRQEGLFSDYINLGILAQRTKDISAAHKNFAEAKRYAEQLGDENLIKAASERLASLPKIN